MSPSLVQSPPGSSVTPANAAANLVGPVNGSGMPVVQNATAAAAAEALATQNRLATETIQKLLDFNQKMDIGLLDRVVDAMYNSSANSQEQKVAQQVLTTLKEHPDAWTKVDTILEFSSNPQTKYYALQILESVIKTKWKILPRPQCEGIKKYIVSLIIKTSSDPVLLDREKTYINKLNMILVQILKREWPKNWVSFIPDIIGASRTNESLCRNNMVILKLLSEELFDFSSGQMTQTRIKHLKDTMCAQFADVFQLCRFVLENSQNAPLVEATLETLLRFLSWIPLGYIFETNMIEMMVSKFLPVAMFRNVSLKCLTEIASVSAPDFDPVFRKIFEAVMDQLEVNMLPLATDIKTAYANGQDMEQKFIQDLALFLSAFLREHARLIEASPGLSPALLKALHYILLISAVDDVEIFKICIEFWNALTYEMYRDIYPTMCLFGSVRADGSGGGQSNGANADDAAGASATIGGLTFTTVTLGTTVYENVLTTPTGAIVTNKQRSAFYKTVFGKVRHIMIERMAKPEEVLVVENEQGEVVREFMRDTDSITLYKNMRETLVYLTHLDYADTERIMMDKLKNQVSGTDWSWKSFNSLCWAIGSISGTMHEEDEIRLLVTVIRDLLVLCERKSGKDNKAIIASNIMYIVGQYPRFLRLHWRFLKTVVVKLFEFMHETHDGVQDMACDTFIKIAQKCKRQFVIVQVDDVEPYIVELLANITSIICDLQPQQVQTFYEAVGYMISAATNAEQQSKWIVTYMRHPNAAWDDIVRRAAETSVEVLRDADVVQRLGAVLKTNVRACKALGHSYVVQLGHIYLDMLSVYKVMSSNIATAIKVNGDQVVKQPLIKAMRVVRKETLRLFSTWVHQSNDSKMVMTNFITPLLDAILEDYQSCNTIVACREPEVLSCIATIVNRLQSVMTPEIPRIFGSVFQCSLEMINKDFENYPDHRINLYQMLAAINQHCFNACIALSGTDFKLILDSIIWAMKHTMRNVGDLGLSILHQLLDNISTHDPQAAVQGFYRTFYITIIEHLFSVVSDSSHTAALGMHSTLLALLFSVVETPGKIIVSLRPEADATKLATDAATSKAVADDNAIYVRDHVASLLSAAFPHLTENQIKITVQGFFNCNTNISLFKEHLRDFLVQIREFTGEDDSDLFLDERQAMLREAEEKKKLAQAQVPGVLTPYEKPDDMQD